MGRSLAQLKIATSNHEGRWRGGLLGTDQMIATAPALAQRHQLISDGRNARRKHALGFPGWTVGKGGSDTIGATVVEDLTQCSD